MTRRLALRKEALTELSSDDLSVVVGGQQSILPTCMCTGYYTSLDAPCPTTTAIGSLPC